MFFVYILQSLKDSNRHYTGFTDDMDNRLKEHNAGNVKPTKAFVPWKLMTYIAYDDKEKAVAFERYLKSGSGRSFSKRHF